LREIYHRAQNLPEISELDVSTEVLEEITAELEEAPILKND